jgi:hypothetical protein
MIRSWAPRRRRPASLVHHEEHVRLHSLFRGSRRDDQAEDPLPEEFSKTVIDWISTDRDSHVGKTRPRPRRRPAARLDDRDHEGRLGVHFPEIAPPARNEHERAIPPQRARSGRITGAAWCGNTGPIANHPAPLIDSFIPPETYQRATSFALDPIGSVCPIGLMESQPASEGFIPEHGAIKPYEAKASIRPPRRLRFRSRHRLRVQSVATQNVTAPRHCVPPKLLPGRGRDYLPNRQHFRS